MSFDMSQFYEVFFDESKEHLDSMEALLLEVDVAAPDAEALNAIFRAAHSIKGSAATFGFTDVAALTHVMETLLDRVRKAEAKLTEEIVDACLAAGDVLRKQLDAHRNGGRAEQGAADLIRARLTALSEASLGAGSAAQATGMQRWQIRYCVPTGKEGDEAAAANLLTELGSLGELLATHAPSTAAEPWQIELLSAHDAATLRSVLEFVATSDSIEMKAVAMDDAAPAEEAEAYGFFEPLTANVAAEAVTHEAEDESFGLFVPLPVPQAASAPALPPAPAAKLVSVAAPAAALAEPASAAPRTEAKSKRSTDGASIRVNVERVDQMINLVGELVITQAMLSQAASQIDPVLYERLHNGIALLERNTRDIQEAVMSIRMLPISTVFTRFPRVVRDLSHKLGKSVELVTSGESTELDKTLIELISDPLTHLVRNSLDHGIEMPEARRAAGKSEVGHIHLRAYHQSGNIVIEVADDGAGLRRERILAKARERGLNASDAMSDQEVWQLIFEPGFSTAEKVTDVSGRGVGMDVVKRNITALGGRVELDSVPGVGTRVSVRLPLTLAILDGMSVALGDEVYIIPLDYVVESLQPSEHSVRTVSGAQRLLEVRGEYLPILDLHKEFRVSGGRGAYAKGIMVVIESDGNKAAVFVDNLIGQHQVVIKSLEANYRRVPGVSGATIMGDGHVAMIVDPPQLVAMARRSVQNAA